MLQREVALRCVARCGQADYGSLAVLHTLTVDAQIQQDLGPGSFFPTPKVHSSFLRLWPRATLLLQPGELLWVERVVRASFAKRRKTILNALRAAGFVPREDRSVLEAALLVAGASAGLDKDELARELPEVREEAFDDLGVGLLLLCSFAKKMKPALPIIWLGFKLA